MGMLKIKYPQKTNLESSMSLGALVGARIFTIYAIVESCFLALMPWLLQPNYLYSPIHTGFIATQFAVFLLSGSVIGSLLGAIGHFLGLNNKNSAKISLELFLNGILTASGIVLFFLNLTLHSWWRSPTCLTILGILAVFVVAWVFQYRFSKWKFLFTGITSPWTVSFLLPGTVWVKDYLLPTMQQSLSTTVDVNSDNAKILAPLIYIVSILIIAILISVINRLGTRLSENRKESSVSYSIGFISVAMGVLTLNLILNQGVYTDREYTDTVDIPSGQPNVIIISLDTTRADHLSLYGYDRNTTPNLIDFAKHAIVYNRAFAASDMTLPTHASIFTGLYPLQHGAHYDPPEVTGARALSDQFLTLAEILGAHQFLNLGVVSNYGFLGHGVGIPQGFNYYDSRMPVVFLKKINSKYLCSWIREFLIPYFEPADYDTIYRNAEKINHAAFNLLNNLDKKNQRPFFLFINYMDPHFPYIPPPPYDTYYPGKLKHFDSKYYAALNDGVLEQKRSVSESEHRHMVSQYDGEIANLDYHLGQLFARLKQSDLFENSLIIITADHGEAFGERHLIQHAVSVYQDQVYVPLLVKLPNSLQSEIVNQVVSSIDILPTVLDVLEIDFKIPNGQGISLLNIDPTVDRFVISESYPNAGLRKKHERFKEVQRAIYSGSLKLIESTASNLELFDLSEDPNELTDLSESRPSATERLHTQYTKWLSITSRIYGIHDNDNLNPEVLLRLKTLGYIQ